ncbi:MAG: DUF3575 domain-containing protein [Chlorobi bacterium]|nr:DUF3575 domain-containing protein [Chlorobiota bacterium]
MKSRKVLLIAGMVVCSLFSTINSNAQTDTVVAANVTSDPVQVTDNTGVEMNIIKLNLLSPFFKNISIQYERVINKFLSVDLTVSFMPNTTLPYKNLLIKMTGYDDPAKEDAIRGIKMSTYSISPEVRFYTGKKGYGKGFYVALSYRYSHFELNKLTYIYADYPAADSSVSFTGKMNVHYAGVLLGAQWFVGKHFTIDWWFFGPLVGYERSSVKGIASVPLSQEDQDDLRDYLEAINFPNTEKTINVDQYGATVGLKGLMYGMRFGLALGFRF